MKRDYPWGESGELTILERFTLSTAGLPAADVVCGLNGPAVDWEKIATGKQLAYT